MGIPKKPAVLPQGDPIEAIAQEIVKADKGGRAYASHFRRLARIKDFASRAELVAWLAGLSDEEIDSLAKQLQKVEGRPRPHFTAAMKLARSLAQREAEEASMPAEFPEALRWAMSRAGMGVNKLAREVGLSRPTIRRWLKGHDRPTSKERIERIEEALGLSPGALTSRVRRWEVKDTGVYKEGATGRLAEIGSTFLRLAAQARYGKPVADLSPEERAALRGELLALWERRSERQIRTKIAQEKPFSLPFDRWPDGVKEGWKKYEVWAGSERGSQKAVEASLKTGSVPRRRISQATLSMRRGEVEKFLGYLVQERGFSLEDLSLDLLGDYDLVWGYLNWRWKRFEGSGVAQVTRSDEKFLDAILHLIRKGFIKGDLERLKELRRVVGHHKVENPGYHNVEPLLEEENPLDWVRRGIAFMLEDLASMVGDLLDPSLEGKSRHEKGEVAALYRDALIWWAMSIHPLRARHWYGARIDWEGLDRLDQRGNLYRDPEGRYHLLYRPEEFKNQHSAVFRHQGDRPLLFPLDEDLPPFEMAVGGVHYRLNSLMDTYLRVVHPLLAQVQGDRNILFPGLYSPKALHKMFKRRSPYVLALPGVPRGLRPFGPHSMRHIVATTAVKRTKSLEHAANLLLDSIQMVQHHYARFLPEDRYRASLVALHGRSK